METRSQIHNNHGRLHYIDVARGGVILCVIIGHLVPFGKLVWLWIFSFHMPFFLVSGYCTGNNSQNLAFLQYLKKYCNNLLLPSLTIRIVLQITGVAGIEY